MSDPVTITGPGAITVAATAPEPVTVSLASVGPQGPKGEGVPAGGVAGQVLMKRDDEDFASTWANVPQPDAIDGGIF